MRNIYIFILLLLTIGCASTSTFIQDNKLMQSALTWIDQTDAIVVEKAFATDQDIFVQYSTFITDSDQGRTFYIRANLGSDEEMNEQTESIAMNFVDKEVLDLAPDYLQPIKTLDEDVWLDFLDTYGKDEKVDSTEEMTRIFISSFKKYLQEQDINEEKVLVVTSHSIEDNQLFLYVDFKESRTIDLVLEKKAIKKYKQNVLRKTIRSADQIILKGQILGVAARPVSSSYRLFAWTKGTTVQAITPHRLALLNPLDDEISELYDGPSMDLVEFEKSLDKVVGSNQSSGTIKYFIGGEEYFKRQEEAFRNAEESIDVRIFIFDSDDYAVELADILKHKSNEKDVAVRVLLDGIGVLMGEGKVSETLPDGFIPPPSMVKYLQEDSNVEVKVRPNAWFKADHTKTIFIDDDICFTGGMNFGREYRYDWHDLMMELKGPIVGNLLNEFEIAWAHAGKLGDIAYLKTLFNKDKVEEVEEGYPIRPLFTRANDPQIWKAQLEAIKQSKKYIYISNAYFSDYAILNELIKARRRGVDVRVVLPVHGNHEVMNKNNIVKANIMFKNGIKVYFYPGMSHIKAAVYDGWMTTGSANFDKLSLKDNLEFNLATSHPEAVNNLIERLFKPDFEKSLEMTEPLKSGLRERIAEFLAEQL